MNTGQAQRARPVEIRTEVLQLQPLPSRAFFPYLNGVLVPTLWPCVFVCVCPTHQRQALSETLRSHFLLGTHTPEGKAAPSPRSSEPSLIPDPSQQAGLRSDPEEPLVEESARPHSTHLAFSPASDQGELERPSAINTTSWALRGFIISPGSPSTLYQACLTKGLSPLRL